MTESILTDVSKDALFPDPLEEWDDFLAEKAEQKLPCPQCNTCIDNHEASRAAGVKPKRTGNGERGMYQCPECDSMLVYRVELPLGGQFWRRVCHRDEYDEWLKEHRRSNVVCP